LLHHRLYIIGLLISIHQVKLTQRSSTPLGFSNIVALNLKENTPLDGHGKVSIEAKHPNLEEGIMNVSCNDNNEYPTGSIPLKVDPKNSLKSSLQAIIATCNLHDEAIDTEISQSAKYVHS